MIPFADDPRDPSWGSPSWPSWVTAFRPWQIDAVNQICEQFDAGTDVVMLNAPTGSGKTIIAEATRRLSLTSNAHALYVANTKGLQDQFMGDFGDYAVCLKGRSNYLTADYPTGFKGHGKFRVAVSAADCAKRRISLPACDDCDPDRQTEEGETALHCDLCFVGSTVLTAAQTEKVFSRWYEGPVVTVRTASGNELTGTPNHPVLTPRGWVSLGELHRGDHLVRSSFTEKMSGSDPHIQNNPPSIAEIERALSVSGIANHRVSGVEMDFHGDGMDGEVNVVWPTGELRNSHNSALTEPITKQLFALANETVYALPSDSDLMLGLSRALATAQSVVGGSGIEAPVLGSQSGHSIGLRLTAIPQNDSSSDKATTHQSLADREGVSDGADGFPLQVTLDEVIGVDVSSHAGQVYNLETSSGWYLANDFIAHNCHPWFFCPYQAAKAAALNAKLAVTNTAYFLTEANGPGMFSERDLVIADEADTLEGILMGQYEVFISRRQQKKYGLSPPEKKTVTSSWIEWAAYAKLRMAEVVKGIKGHSIEVVKERNAATRLLASLDNLHSQLLADNAIYDDYEKGDIRFKVIRVDQIAPTHIWQHAKKWLLMSATIIDPTEYIASLGVEQAGLSWALVNVPSTFPPENRPIHIRPVADMTWKNRDEAWPASVGAVAKILDRHPTDRILVHTVSYDLARYLKASLETSRPVLVYDSAATRDATLAEFRKTEGAVLLAPSMERGVDLPHDACRVVIVAKIPFLNLRDKVVKKRMHQRDGSLWYAVQTIRALVQMTGRHVRSIDDVGNHTYIIDKQFVTNLFKNNRHLMPSWWRESLNWTGDPDCIHLGGR